MNDEIKNKTKIYEHSSIPTIIFNKEMEVIWNNESFQNYFTGIKTIGSNISALTRTPLKKKLQTAKGHSGRFYITISTKHSLSSIMTLLVFPFCQQDGFPEHFIAYCDDLTSDRKMMLRKTYLGLLEASKLKDDDTGNHIKRVGAYARRLSEECFQLRKYSAIDPDFIENIHFLAPMHDVGKIGTPDEILTKRGPLNDAQWLIMKQHTINGALILSNYPDKMASEIARSHHEKWDGSGYPFGLSGNDIPLSARITAISDVYDALRMERSYKKAFSHDKAVEILVESKGSHFDPELIEIFMTIHTSFRDIYQALSDDLTESSIQEVEDLPIYVEESLEEIVELPEELEEIGELEEL